MNVRAFFWSCQQPEVLSHAVVVGSHVALMRGPGPWEARSPAPRRGTPSQTQRSHCICLSSKEKEEDFLNEEVLGGVFFRGSHLSRSPCEWEGGVGEGTQRRLFL